MPHPALPLCSSVSSTSDLGGGHSVTGSCTFHNKPLSQTLLSLQPTRRVVLIDTSTTGGKQWSFAFKDSRRSLAEQMGFCLPATRHTACYQALPSATPLPSLATHHTATKPCPLCQPCCLLVFTAAWRTSLLLLACLCLSSAANPIGSHLLSPAYSPHPGQLLSALVSCAAVFKVPVSLFFIFLVKLCYLNYKFT